MMQLLACCLGGAAIIFINTMFLIVRYSAQDKGLEVSWWRGGYVAERRYLRTLAESEDPAVAKRARLCLRLEIIAWVMVAPAAIILLWECASR